MRNIQFAQKFDHIYSKKRKIALNYAPDNLGGYVVVTVDDPIARFNYLTNIRQIYTSVKLSVI